MRFALLFLLLCASPAWGQYSQCMPGMPCYQGAQPSNPNWSTRPATWCDAIVKVNDKGNYTSTGSGTPVKKVNGGVIVLTNNHVVDDRESDTSVSVIIPGNGTFPGEVLGTDKDLDVAAIFIKADVPCVGLGSEQEGAEFQSRGHAGGKSFRVYHGRITNRLRYGYFLSSPSYNGMSGGGVFQNQKYVGIIWGGDPNYCAITSVKYIRPWLNSLLGRVVVDVETQVVPVEAPPKKPNTPPPGCPSCNGGQDISALQELHADLVLRVENVERGIGNFPKPDMSTIEKKIDTLEKRVDAVSKSQGPPGEDGKDGRDGKDAVIDEDALANRVAQIVLAQIDTPQPTSDAKYYVLVADNGASYWSRLAAELSKAQEGYSKIKVAQPPNYSVGALPQLVEYQSGKPLRTIAGSHDVSNALSYLARGATP